VSVDMHSALLSALRFDTPVGLGLRFGSEVLFWTTVRDCVSFSDCGLKLHFGSEQQFIPGLVRPMVSVRRVFCQSNELQVVTVQVDSFLYSFFVCRCQWYRYAVLRTASRVKSKP